MGEPREEFVRIGFGCRWMDEARPTKVFGIVCRPSVSRRSGWEMWVDCRG